MDQSDVIFRILPYYREALVANTTPVVMNVHMSFNPKEGYFERLYYSRSKQERFKVYLWSPWIIQYVLRKNGFSKVRIDPYADPTTMAQTYLVTARE